MTALLSLVQWLSPAFPTGAFAHSQGLEWAIAEGGLRGAGALQGWLADVLDHGTGRQDALLLALSLRQGADVPRLAALACALAASAERLEETLVQGAALARTVQALTGREVAPAPLPVALGQAAAPLGLPVPQVVALYLQSAMGNLVSCAVRFMPLGATEGQAVLAALAPRIAALADWAATAGEDDLGGFTPGADLAAMRHETMDVRIYRT